MVEQSAPTDVVITTALVPGRPAPVLITEEAVRAMHPGAVIVDLAAEAGGNCALTVRDQTVVSPKGVQIRDERICPRRCRITPRQLYSRNVHALLAHMMKEGTLAMDMEDEITRGTTIVHEGAIVHQPTLDALGAGAAS